ncbi:MAG: type II/IV secretion system protein [Planctomycetes bacterium]|nr:type II/IV secretion system protein [Planctomycetota bacterium]
MIQRSSIPSSLAVDRRPNGPLDVGRVRVDPAWALRVPATLALRRQVLPFACVDEEVHVACANVADTAALKAIERHVPRSLRPVAAEPDSLRRVLQRVFGGSAATAEVADEPISLADEIIFAGWLRQASDIHLDPGRDGVRVRLRVDGVLDDYRTLSLGHYPELVSRIKVLGGMDVAERRAPQDGRFTQSFHTGDDVDIRVATLPTKYGERVTLRLLAIDLAQLTLENLGMSARDFETFERAIRLPHGLLLATGPTGCGKTSTLCAALQHIVSRRSVNAISVQDPIEYDIPGVAQIEVNSDQKITFARALRSILRHDPDVLMIGEIRDRETAEIAVQAALTGHLVLATLHANSAVAAVTRLADLGVERYLITATLRLVLSQRLVRRLCPTCRTPRRDPVVGLPGSRSFTSALEACEPRGCIYCMGRGYSGRIGLFEMLAIDEDWEHDLSRGVDTAALTSRMRERGVPTIVDDALDKIRGGVTSVDEVVSVVEVRGEVE